MTDNKGCAKALIGLALGLGTTITILGMFNETLRGLVPYYLAGCAVLVIVSVIGYKKGDG